jgi:hypothetical protein
MPNPFLAVVRKLAESKHVNNAIRKNIYIHSVDCACEWKANKNDTSMIDGRNCFCDVDVDLMGTNKHIKTNIDQPTDMVRMRVDPKDFKSLADTSKFE